MLYSVIWRPRLSTADAAVLKWVQQILLYTQKKWSTADAAVLSHLASTVEYSRF
jgi:hypothetical protein